jgi:LEA14-like dessication related protein
MTLTGLTFSDASVDLFFDLDNPNIFPIPLKKYEYTVKIGDHTVFRGEQGASIEVPAQGRGRLTVPVSVRFGEVTEAVRLLEDTDMWPYSVAGSVTIDVGPLAGISVPFSHRDTLPRPMPPTVTVERLNVRSFGFTSIDMDVVLSFRNTGRIAYTLTSLAGSIALNGQQFISIERLREGVRLGSNGVETITIPVRLSASQLARGLQAIISEGRADYRFTGDAGLATDRFGTLPLTFDESGNVRLFR